MKTLPVVLTFILVSSLVLVMTSQVALARPVNNLLVNPDAETGDLSGWTLLADGGSGWNIDTGKGKDGTNSFATSYSWCKRFQEIDLLATGYTMEQLDTSPDIEVGEWFAGYGAVWMYDYAHEDYAYLKVELRDNKHDVIAAYDTGTFQCPDNNGQWWGPWVSKGHKFSDYGDGLRYIYFEDGGKDREYWAGYYGTRIDGAYVYIINRVPGFSFTGALIAACSFAGLIAFLSLRNRSCKSRLGRW